MAAQCLAHADDKALPYSMPSKAAASVSARHQGAVFAFEIASARVHRAASQDDFIEAHQLADTHRTPRACCLCECLGPPVIDPRKVCVRRLRGVRSGAVGFGPAEAFAPCHFAPVAQLIRVLRHDEIRLGCDAAAINCRHPGQVTLRHTCKVVEHAASRPDHDDGASHLAWVSHCFIARCPGLLILGESR